MGEAQRAPVQSMKNRKAFLNAAKGVYLPRHAFVMQRNRQEDCSNPRFGLTVTKKCGNAVVRNRIRRRLKEAFRQVDQQLLESGTDYVLVGRNAALTVDFHTLCADIKTTLKKLARGDGRPARPRKDSRRSG